MTRWNLPVPFLDRRESVELNGSVRTRAAFALDSLSLVLSYPEDRILPDSVGPRVHRSRRFFGTRRVAIPCQAPANMKIRLCQLKRRQFFESR